MKNHDSLQKDILAIMVFGIVSILVQASSANACGKHFNLPDESCHEYSVVEPDDLTRWYFVDEPDNTDWNRGTLSPVVLFFHGALRDAEGMYDLVRWDDPGGYYDINTDNVITVYPEGTNWRVPHFLFWNDGRNRTWEKTGRGAAKGADDVGFVIAMLNELVRIYHIDESRIYAAGASNGGIFVQRLAIELPTQSRYRLAAIASVNGLLSDPDHADYTLAGNPPAIPEMINNVSVPPTPVLIINGTVDMILHYNGMPSGEQSVLLSAEESVSAWVDHNGQGTFEYPTGFDSAPYFGDRQILLDGCKVYRYWWTDDSQNNQRNVVFYKIKGGNHFWPWEGAITLWSKCKDFSTTEDIWKFFSRESLR
ncbi:MAG: hypothetical protein KJ737_22120 [Proteobacteria bacterium]|nr:hypothetical protein [Pseudomonadota bacterium]